MKRLAPALLAAALAAAPAIAASAEPALQRYIDEALHSNDGLRADSLSLAASAEALRAARSRYWPRLSLNARYTRSDGGRTIEIPTGDLVNPIYQTLNQLTADTDNPTNFPTLENQSIRFLRPREQDTRLSLVAPLFAPAVGAGVDAERHGLRARGAAHEAYARSLVREVKRAYYQAAQAEAGVGILEASLRTLEENQRVAEALVQAGKATRDRALRAQAERLAVTQRLIEARDDAAQARRLLNVLRNADAEAAIDLADTPAVPEAPPAGSGLRPELRQVDSAADAADAAARGLRTQYWPTLSFAADVGYQGEDYAFDRDQDFATASLVLSWTLFDFGQRRAELAQSRLAAAELRARRAELARQLALATQAARDRRDTAQRSLETAEARLQAAEEGFRIAARKRDAGSLSEIEFLDAERSLTEARLGRSIARYGLLDAAAELELATATYPLPAALAGPTPE